MTKKSERASWLRIDDVTRPEGGVRVLWDECQQRLGYVREFLKIPFETDRLTFFQGYVNRLMRSDDCQLSGRERELIALVVSLENRCEACIITHAGALQAHGMDSRTADVVLANWRRADLTERERALAEFASNLTLHCDMASEDDLQALRDVGLKELEILEVVQIVAIFNATNRLNAGLGIKIEDGAHKAFR